MASYRGNPGRGGRFGDSLLDEIRAKTDIVGVIGEYVQLKKRGANFLGLCPFHQEKTPSFTVSPDKQMFYCFGCQTGGNVFSFLMQREGLSFAEAVEQLAARAGVAIPDKTSLRASPQDLAVREQRKKEIELLYEVTELAARYFHKALLKSPEAEKARAYLKRRGIQPATVETFRLGYSLESWNDLHKYLRGKGYTDALLERAGLVARGRGAGRGRSEEPPDAEATTATAAPAAEAVADTAAPAIATHSPTTEPAAPAAPPAPASYYDRFRGRLMFTISDHRGRPIGFGARALRDGDEPKYLNSPETPLFSKGRGLYAIHLAAQSIRQGRRALVAEGYMDVIGCHEFGFDFAVASMGTAFTVDQARALRRLTDTVVTAFDSDTAGTQATIRGLEILTASDFKVRVAEIPGGKDPDECLRAEGGRVAFGQAVDEAVPLAEYRFRLACRRYDPATIEGRVAAVQDLLPVLAGIESPLERDEYLRDFARRLPVPEESLRLEFGRYLKAAVDPHRRRGESGGGLGPGADGTPGAPGGAGRETPGGLRDSIERMRHNKQSLAGGEGAGVSKQVADAERTLLGYMVLGEDTLHPVLTELLEAAAWCSEIGLPEPAAAETEADAGAEVAVALGQTADAGETAAADAATAADQPAEPLTATEATVLDWFFVPAHRRLVRTLLGLARYGVVGGAQLVDVMADDTAGRLASRVVFEAHALPDEPERAIRDCINVLKEHRLNSRIEELHRRITDLERQGAQVELEYADLMRELIELARYAEGGTGHWRVPGR